MRIFIFDMVLFREDYQNLFDDYNGNKICCYELLTELYGKEISFDDFLKNFNEDVNIRYGILMFIYNIRKLDDPANRCFLNKFYDTFSISCFLNFIIEPQINTYSNFTAAAHSWGSPSEQNKNVEITLFGTGRKEVAILYRRDLQKEISEYYYFIIAALQDLKIFEISIFNNIYNGELLQESSKRIFIELKKRYDELMTYKKNCKIRDPEIDKMLQNVSIFKQKDLWERLNKKIADYKIIKENLDQNSYKNYAKSAIDEDEKLEYSESLEKQDNLICLKCQDRNPKMFTLGCGHQICIDCAQKEFIAQYDIYKCPMEDCIYVLNEEDQKNIMPYISQSDPYSYHSECVIFLINSPIKRQHVHYAKKRFIVQIQ